MATFLDEKGVAWTEEASKAKISHRGLPDQRTCEANAADENISFIFTVGVKSVPVYQVKLACVVLHMAGKDFF